MRRATRRPRSARLAADRLVVERLEIASGALRAEEAAVDFYDSFGARALMEAGDVLRHQKETVTQTSLDGGQRPVAGIGLHALRLFAPQ